MVLPSQYAPRPAPLPTPCATFRILTEAGLWNSGSVGAPFSPEWFLKHFSSWLEKEKEIKKKKNRLPDNVSLVGANVRFFNVVLMPNPI